MQQRKVIVYIAMSLDGFIAGDQDSLDFLSTVEVPGEDYGYNDFIKTVDTVIIGRKTYDKVLSFGIPFPHVERQCYVLSRSRSGHDKNVTFFNGPVQDLITKIRKQEGSDIFIDGGAEVIDLLLKEHLVDRYIISVIPSIVGTGVQLFKNGRPAEQIRQIRSLTFPGGLVQLWYDRVEKEDQP